MDSLQFVPFLVFGVAVLLVLVLPLGRDLLIPVFLLPWTALTPDIGANMPLSKMLMLILLIKYALSGRISLARVPQLSLYLIAALIGVASAAITLATETVRIDYFGGELRNGWFRVGIVTFGFVLSLVPFALLLARDVPHSVARLLQVYVWSVLVLCVIGIVQFIIFRVTGIDVLPIGIFAAAEGETRSGQFQLDGELELRPSSLAGEPKNLGMFAASAIILLAAFGKLVFASTVVRAGAGLVALVTIILTQSTSAFLSLPIGLGVYAALRLIGRPLGTGTIFFIYAAASLVLLAVFLERVSTAPVPTNEAAIAKPAPTTLGELIYERSIGRIEVEDMDWVILKPFVDDPVTGIIGRGFGLGHLAAGPYIPEAWRHYMEGRIIFPKTGVTYWFVNGGVVFVLLMAAYLARLTPTVARGVDAGPERMAGVRSAQLALLPLVVLLILRIYVLEVALFVAAVCLIVQRPGQSSENQRSLHVRRPRGPLTLSPAKEKSL